jgi:hypothetical protein
MKTLRVSLFLKRLARFALVLAAISVPGRAYAAPILWTLPTMTFGPGDTLAGSFIYDADTNTYSSVAFTKTGAFAASYDTGDLSLGTSSELHLITNFGPADLSNERFLILYFIVSAFVPNPLTNAGGNVLTSITFGDCDNSDCTSGTFDGNSGPITGTPLPVPVPEPTAMMLLGMGLAAGGVRYRRQRRG